MPLNSIIDISKKNSQPRKRKKNVLVFNGEIYNFEIKKKSFTRHYAKQMETQKFYLKCGSNIVQNV